MFKFPVYRPLLGGRERDYVVDCLDSTWISSKGAYLSRFESAFASYTGVQYASAVCNGTVALHLALITLGIGPGDEVIVPTLTYIASVNAITYTGATPVFVDSEADTWQMDPDDVSRKITPRTRAIMVVHLYGHPCNMDSLCAIAKQNGLFLVEDCAEAFGTRCGDRHVGSFGDIATYSFFGNKTITTGEGGMVVTNDPTLHDRSVKFKGQGLAQHRQYWHDVIGYNYRMTNLSAAIGLAQLERASEILERKRSIMRWYREALVDTPVRLQNEAANASPSYWMVSILVPDGDRRDSLRNHLESAGIETRPLFYPVHTMPMYAQRFQRHPVAEDLAWRGINLPSYPELNASDIEEIASVVRSFFSTRKRDD